MSVGLGFQKILICKKRVSHLYWAPGGPAKLLICIGDRHIKPENLTKQGNQSTKKWTRDPELEVLFLRNGSSFKNARDTGSKKLHFSSVPKCTSGHGAPSHAVESPREGVWTP